MIDTHPVTNRDFLIFIAAGGYESSQYWSEAGWRWRTDSSAVAPKHWIHRDGVWCTRTMDRSGPVDPAHPVCHVSWYEAEAFARCAGKRLPTEIEWEAAASWDPATGVSRAYPWGDAPPISRSPTSINSRSAPRPSAAIRRTSRRSGAPA